MNEYRVQRLKEDLTFAQRRNSRQRQQLANYKKVHEKDLKEKERLNNIINELEKYINEEYIYDELGMKIFDATTLQDKLQELKGSDSNGR